MKFLPHSNGVQKLNIKRKLKPMEVVKEVSIIVGVILLVGFVYQRVSNFIANETLKPRVDYARVNGSRFDYKLKGEGEYTVIFDGAVGTTLTQWDAITEELEELDLSTFVYNRSGYGYSDSSKEMTPKEQAEELKILLRKAAVPGPYILVGEEYGSLVLSYFAESAPEDIAGVVLIDPITKEMINNPSYKKSIFWDKFRRKIEYLGSGFGFTTLMDIIGLEVKMDEYRNKLGEEQLDEFDTLRTKSRYTKGVSNEMNALYKEQYNIKNNDLFKSVPVYILAKKDQEGIKSIGNEKLTKIKTISEESKYIAINNKDSIVDGIKYVTKEARDISRKNKKK